MNDEFIRSLKSDWQSQQIDATEVLRRLQRNRWVPHLVLAAEMFACGLAFVVGLWFAWIAAHHDQHRLLYALSAGVLLLSAPALCIACVLARTSSLLWNVETPESLLLLGVRRADSSLKAIRIGRWHIAIMAGFVATLWAAEGSGLIEAADFLICYTLVCTGVSTAGLLWMGSRERRVRNERAACAQLLKALRVDAGEDA